MRENDIIIIVHIMHLQLVSPSNMGDIIRIQWFVNVIQKAFLFLLCLTKESPG